MSGRACASHRIPARASGSPSAPPATVSTTLTLWQLTEEEAPTLYFSLYSGWWAEASIAVRSDLDAVSLATPIEKILAQLDPDLPVSDVLTMEQSIDKSTVDASFTSILVLTFAVIALFLAAVGLYNVLSYLGTQRTGEIGIRIALGASRNSVLRLMLLDGLRPAGLGLVLGIVAGASMVRPIRSLLYNSNALDWSVFAERRWSCRWSRCWPACCRRGGRRGSIRYGRCGLNNL